jgi:hypothetical protein
LRLPAPDGKEARTSDPNVRVVSNTNTGNMPPRVVCVLPPPRFPLRRDSSTERHRAGLSCSRRSVLRNQCTVSRRPSSSSDPSFFAEEEPLVIVFEAEEDEDDDVDDDERPNDKMGGGETETANGVEVGMKVVGTRRAAAGRLRYAE